MIASLGMYDGGELASANDALWSAIAGRLRARGVQDVPDSLSRDPPAGADRLLLGQICGYPFVRRLHARLAIVGAPIYELPGCEGHMHRSFIVVRAASPIHRLEQLLSRPGARAVINDHESTTGRNLFGDALADIGARAPFFAQIIVSGSHRRSLVAIAQGEADVAAIDCITYALVTRADPALAAATRIVHRTRATPTLPFVTERANPAALQCALFEAIREALTDRRSEIPRRALGLAGIASVDPQAYEITRQFAARADTVLGPVRSL